MLFKKTFSCFVLLLLGMQVWANLPFEKVYREFQSIPKGLLEAVSYHQTHIKHIPAGEPEGCSGIPKVYGLMGLTLDGKNYFNENLRIVSDISGVSVADIISDPYMNVWAWAKAFEQLRPIAPALKGEVNWKTIAGILNNLSEIPDSGLVNQFARDCQLYAVFTFLNDPEKASLYGFAVHNIDLVTFFGSEKYAVLSSPRIKFTDHGITGNGHTYPQVMHTRSVQYRCVKYCCR